MIHFLEPLQHSAVGPNPRVKWYVSAALPAETKFRLVVYSQDRKPLQTYNLPAGDSFLIPQPLSDGDYQLRIVGEAPDTRRFLSKYALVTVNPKEAFKHRILCAAPWSSLFLGPIRANPCCNLKSGAGFPFNPEVSTIDPWNSPGMIALRQALLLGDTKFCHEGCPVLRASTSRASPESYARTAGAFNMDRVFGSACPEHENVIEAFVRGRVILDHPLTLKIALGSKCNHACTFCKSRQRDWKQEESVFTDLAVRFAPKICRLMLTGGEPLLYWKHFNRKMRQSNIDLSKIIISMITNGGLLEEAADDLKDCMGLELFISFNAATRETYRRVHGVDDFEKVIRGIRAIQRVRSGRPTKIRLKMVYMRSTFREIKTYVELAKDLQVSNAAFTNMTYFRKAEAPATEAMQLHDPEWPEAERLLTEASVELSRHGIGFSARRPGEKRLDPKDVLDEAE